MPCIKHTPVISQDPKFVSYSTARSQTTPLTASDQLLRAQHVAPAENKQFWNDRQTQIVSERARKGMNKAQVAADTSSPLMKSVRQDQKLGKAIVARCARADGMGVVSVRLRTDARDFKWVSGAL